MPSLRSPRRARRATLLVLWALLTFAVTANPATAATSTRKDPFAILQPLQLTYNFATKTGSLVIGSTATTFRLARAAGSAGLYRKAVAVGGVPTVTGWIVGNDALVVGTDSVAGKPIVSLAETAGSAGADLVAETISTGSTGSDPVPAGLLKNLRCGRLNPILGRMTDLGCNTALLGSSTQSTK